MTNEVGRFDHGLEVRNGHSLVGRDAAEELVRGDVVEVNKAFVRPDEENGRGEGYAYA